jgi:hypothetical protein
MNKKDHGKTVNENELDESHLQGTSGYHHHMHSYHSTESRRWLERRIHLSRPFSHIPNSADRVKNVKDTLQAHLYAADAHKDAASVFMRSSHKAKRMAAAKKAGDMTDRAHSYEQKHSKLHESIDYKVNVNGLPPFFMNDKNPSVIKQRLRKLLRKPDSIENVSRITKGDLKKYFRMKGQGKETENEEQKEDFKWKDTAAGKQGMKDPGSSPVVSVNTRATNWKDTAAGQKGLRNPGSNAVRPKTRSQREAGIRAKMNKAKSSGDISSWNKHNSILKSMHNLPGDQHHLDVAAPHNKITKADFKKLNR